MVTQSWKMTLLVTTTNNAEYFLENLIKIMEQMTIYRIYHNNNTSFAFYGPKNVGIAVRILTLGRTKAEI